MDNVDAGPSSHRHDSTPRRQVDAPKTARRKSWFGLGSPRADPPSEPALEVVDHGEGPSTLPRGSWEEIDVPRDEDWLEGETGTIKRKKKKQRSLPKADPTTDDEEGEVMRMEDLSLSSRRRESETTIKRFTHDPGGSPASSLATTPHAPPQPLLRAHSDLPTPFQTDVFHKSVPLGDSSAPVLPRTSSSSSRPNTMLQTDKTQPPTPADRPLPPLPPPTDSATPPLPTEIVIMPSTPRHPSNSSGFREPPRIAETLHAGPSTPTRNRSRSASPGSQHRAKSPSPSSTARNGSPQKPSPIGLGRPGMPRSPGSDEPPPLPAKPVAVSTPVRMGNRSPGPRIIFAEPEERPASGRSTPTEDPRVRVRRARSLSGMWKGSSPAPTPQQTSRPTTPEPLETLNDPEEEVVIKATGVLGWLGVKKTVKRRQSEGRLPRATLHSEKGVGEFGESAETPSQTSSRRPSQEPLPSSITPTGDPVLPAQPSPSTTAGTPSRISTFFSRRPSARAEDLNLPCETPPLPNSPPLAPAQARPIPNSQRHVHSRPTTAESSRSSLQLEGDSYSSGQVADPDQWVSTPDAEETLHSPEGLSNWGPGVRPWMDGLEYKPSSAPLDALPEKEVLATRPRGMTMDSQASSQNRVRAWSDASRTRPAPSRNSSETYLPQPPPRSLQPSPFEANRPKLPGRSSSANTAIIGRMKSAFLRSSNRSKTTAPTVSDEPEGMTSEFGSFVPQEGTSRTGGIRMRPTSSSSSDVGSTRPRSRRGISFLNPSQSALLGLQEGDRQIFLNETPDRSPRTSFTAASVSSVTSASTKHSGADSLSRRNKGRARASTLSAAPSSSILARPVSPHVYPVAATPPRRRASAISRLSHSILSSGTSSPKGSTFFPLPPRSSGSLSSVPYTSTRSSDEPSSLGTSPRPSAGSSGAAMGNAALKAVSVRIGEETPEQYLERINHGVGPGDIATVLASSADEFHLEALRVFMKRFDFTHNALDVALRKLLLVLSLPKETQQIDRIIEAFAVRYEECEPGLFITKDNTYILAFSMIMLHTDAFNKHNKNKMTKPDYVKNTRLDGVNPAVLEAFYDNITFTPFIFVEDDLIPQSAPASSLGLDALPPSSAGPSTPSSSILQTPRSSSKVDVYQLIATDGLDPLRVDIERHVPIDNPFSCLGTRPFLDIDSVHGAFANAPFLPVIPVKRRSSTASLIGGPSTSSESETILRVTKVGLLSRKDDGPENGKKLSRKWKSWSVVLTSSQLLFFKDPTWALSLQEQIRQRTTSSSGHPVALSTLQNFKPDEVFPVSQCIAAYDKTLGSHPNSFRYLMPPGRTYLLQATDEYEMNEWIGLINYASTYKTADTRMRPSEERHAQRRDETANAPRKGNELARQLHRFQAQHKQLSENLQSNLRLARNLAILTPFQRSTRERIANAVPSVAHRIRQDRLHLAKVQCWINILRQDLGREETHSRARHPVQHAVERPMPNAGGVERVIGEPNRYSTHSDDRRESPEIPKLSLSSPEMDSTSSGAEPRSPCTPDLDMRRSLDQTSSSTYLGRSPGELPIVIRRPSEDERSPRPSYSRQVSTGSYISAQSADDTLSRPQSSQSRSRAGSNTLSVGDPKDREESRPATPTPVHSEQSGASTPMFALSDVEDGPSRTVRAQKGL